MMETFIFKFKENIKRVFSIMINSEVISKYILKDYISEIKVINDYREKEKNTESKSNPNNISKNIIKSNNSSQNLTFTNNLPSKSNNSGHMITTVNNSFLYLNSSFKSLSLDKKEDLMQMEKKIYIIT